MKKIIILISGILICLHALGQDTTSTRTSVFSLPKGSRRLSQEQIEAYGKQHGNNVTTNRHNSKAFQKDGITVIIGDHGIDPTGKLTLERMKQGLESSYTPDDIRYLQSKIITLNDVRFLIFESYLYDGIQLDFYSEQVGNKAVHGTLMYNKADRTKALQYLDQLLQGMKFKKVIL